MDGNHEDPLLLSGVVVIVDVLDVSLFKKLKWPGDGAVELLKLFAEDRGDGKGDGSI